MKKLLFVMVAAIAFVACEKEPFAQANDYVERESSNKVSLSKALFYAENSINGIGTSTRSTTRKVKSTEIFVAKPSTRSAESEEVSFYLINYEDNEGFAMVSTDSRTTPVYAYSDEGNLNPADFENNPGLKIFLEGAILNYEDEIANCSTYALGDGDRYPIIEFPEELMAINDIVELVEIDRVYYFKGIRVNENIKGPFVPVQWHQHLPYGQYFSNQKAGCGPVAAAQVMAYYQYPSNYGTYTFYWTQMLSLPSPIDEISQIYDVRYISSLLYSIGERANVDDSGANTIVSTSNLVAAIRDFGYNCQYMSSYNSDVIKNNISANKPIIISGNCDSEEYGHIWVIDGYNITNYTNTLYYITYPYNIYDASSTDPITYYHCNWGWSPGQDSGQHYYLRNGYFHSNSFRYNDYIEIVHNIQPQTN